LRDEIEKYKKKKKKTKEKGRLVGLILLEKMEKLGN
jgi:hypothetical protein